MVPTILRSSISSSLCRRIARTTTTTDRTKASAASTIVRQFPFAPGSTHSTSRQTKLILKITSCLSTPAPCRPPPSACPRRPWTTCMTCSSSMRAASIRGTRAERQEWVRRSLTVPTSRTITRFTRASSPETSTSRAPSRAPTRIGCTSSAARTACRSARRQFSTTPSPCLAGGEYARRAPPVPPSRPPPPPAHS